MKKAFTVITNIMLYAVSWMASPEQMYYTGGIYTLEEDTSVTCMDTAGIQLLTQSVSEL